MLTSNPKVCTGPNRKLAGLEPCGYMEIDSLEGSDEYRQLNPDLLLRGLKIALRIKRQIREQSINLAAVRVAQDPGGLAQ